ncbi:MAG: hypothetical protein M1829_004806 [Trizodia sp. TS-e1964]|nr:MAG: hypothetical protein M1829_004806 [Trizodia sp. TS-e1964]
MSASQSPSLTATPAPTPSPSPAYVLPTEGWVHNASLEVNAISDYPTILAVCICLTFVMVVVVSMRVYVRSVMLRSFGSDDWTVLVAAIFSIIYNGLCIGRKSSLQSRFVVQNSLTLPALESRWGLGLPIALRPAVNLDTYTVINFAGRPFYQIGIALFKVALCLAYLRIVNEKARIYKAVIWITMIACFLTHLGGALVLFFQCSPVQKSWKPRLAGTCLPNDITFYVLSGITIVFDCIIFFLPIPILAKVNINLRRKIALMGVFLLGLFTTVCSVMRMVQIITIAINGNSTMLVLWGTIELNVGITLTCIPTLTPLFNYFRDVRSGRYYGYRSSGKGTNGTTDTRSIQEIKHSKAVPLNEVPAADSESQKTILGLGASLESQESPISHAKNGISIDETLIGSHREARGDTESQPGYQGSIWRTTEIDVKVQNHGIHAS